MLVLAVDSRQPFAHHTGLSFVPPVYHFIAIGARHTVRYRVTAYRLSSLVASFVSTEPNRTLQRPEIKDNMRFRSRFVPVL